MLQRLENGRNANLMEFENDKVKCVAYLVKTPTALREFTSMPL